jgi:hypothetical protein
MAMRRNGLMAMRSNRERRDPAQRPQENNGKK